MVIVMCRRMEHTRLRLLEAATSGDVNDVIRMLDQDPSLATIVPKHIPVPLASAAREGHVGVMRVLLDRGASPLGLPPDVPIVLASMSAHAEAACALLVEKGADLVARGLNGSTALTMAASTGNMEVVSLLLNHLPPGAVDMTNHWGESALWRAARFGHMAVAQTLLQEGGASSFAPDSRLDLSPQEAARQAGHNHLADHLEVRIIIRRGRFTWLNWLNLLNAILHVLWSTMTFVIVSFSVCSGLRTRWSGHAYSSRHALFVRSICGTTPLFHPSRTALDCGLVQLPS